MEKIERDKLVVVVVWYKPNEQQTKQLHQFVEADLHTVIVDNSANDNSALLSTLVTEKITYLPLHENRGIAAALNCGCHTAKSLGATWVLTMDQDSLFAPNDIVRFVDLANAYTGKNEVAIFVPFHNTRGKIPPNLPRYTLREATMTSGNLLSMSIFEKLGNGFLEELFIDAVDDEYCFRVKRNGYDIVRVNDIILAHPLGEIVKAHCLFFTKKIYTHAPLRFYYITRNSLHLADLYPEQRKRLRKLRNKALRKTLKRTIVYHYPKKWQILRYTIRGIIDYKRGIFGKFQENQ